MRLIAVAALLLPTITHPALAELSSEEAEDRTHQTEEVMEQGPTFEEIAEPEVERQTTDKVPAKQEAYVALRDALANHPEMSAVNQKESRALSAYQGALPGGNPVEISITQQALARAKAARYEKALSIPELKLAIETWQQAATETDTDNKNSAKVKGALESIQTKLKLLSEAIGQ